jgi:hypothetical protein
MWITNSGKARQVVAGGGLVCVALLVTACGSSNSSTAAPTPNAASSTTAPATAAGSPSVSGPAPGAPAVSSPATASASVSLAQTAANTFLAPAQDTTQTPLYKPACDGYGCALSGDSTAFLYRMKWSTWSATQAVGTGTYKLDACNPSCAAGPVYPVATVVTLSQPVKVCSSPGTHWVWSHASFTFPDGLPKALLQGQDAPQNPWTFSSLVTAAQQSCA